MGSSQGNARIQPKTPFPHRARPAISKEAVIVKTVSNVGSATMNVNTAWTNLKPDPRSGSMKRWQTHRNGKDEKQDKSDAPHRVTVSLPPAACGIKV
jgi:hypothetical protein